MDSETPKQGTEESVVTNCESSTGSDKVTGAGDYNASHIRILKPEEVVQRMPWLKAESLAQQYNRDVAFIRRGLRACREAGVSERYFVSRYLEKDPSVPYNPLVDHHSRLLQNLRDEDDEN
jgi:hypothetical protein